MSGKFKLVCHSGFHILLQVSVSLFGWLLYQKFYRPLSAVSVPGWRACMV